MKQVFVNFDKVHAEWVVVAYLAGDPRMIEIIENGEDPHLATGHMISGAPKELILKENKLFGLATDPNQLYKMRSAQLPKLMSGGYFIPRSFSIRQMGKKSNHALNYDETWYRFMMENECEASEAKRCVTMYHRAYPCIRSVFHAGIRTQLKKDRTLRNCFGRKIRFQDAWGNDLLKAAYSALPQSTVADMVIDAMVLVQADQGNSSEAEMLTQTYDSLLIQHPQKWTKLAKACIKIGLEYLCPVCEYRGVEFTIKSEVKVGPNFADLVETPLIPKVKQLAEGLENAYQEACLLQDARSH